MLFEFLVAILLIELTPGPNMAYLALLSASNGRMAGLAATAGASLGLAVHAGLAAIGLGAILQNNPIALDALRILGVFYLVFLAYEAWTPPHAGTAPLSRSAIHGPFARGLIANLLNGKSAVFYALMLPRFMTESGAAIWLQATALGGLHLFVATSVHVMMVLGAAQAHAAVHSAIHRPLVRGLFALALLATALWLALA